MNLSAAQKKVIGLILIIIFGILFLLGLVGVIYAAFFNNDLEAAGSLAFLLFLLYFPFHYGLRLYKRGKNEALILSAPLATDASLMLTVTINLAAYRSLLFQLTYSNLWFVYITCIGLLTIIYAFFYPPTEISLGYFVPLLVLLIPIGVYWQANNGYYSTKSLKEEMTYKINANTIRVFGQTFTSSINWDSLYKVKETKKWFLLYTGNQIAQLIPKDSFQSDADINLLRNFVINTPSILKELRLP